MKINIETNLPLYGPEIACIWCNGTMILVPAFLLGDVIQELIELGNDVDLTSWCTSDIMVTTEHKRWYVYVPSFVKKDQSLYLLEQPYNDSPDSFIVAVGSFDELKLYNKEYPNANIVYINRGIEVAPCYAEEYKLKNDPYIILAH